MCCETNILILLNLPNKYRYVCMHYNLSDIGIFTLRYNIRRREFIEPVRWNWFEAGAPVMFRAPDVLVVTGFITGGTAVVHSRRVQDIRLLVMP